MRRTILAAALAAAAAACASAPVAPPPPPDVPFEQKLSWIVRLEDERRLRDPLPEPPADLPVVPPPRRGAAPPPPPPPPPSPDLVRLLGDADARVRRRAALAVGRVGLPAAVPPLVALLDDGEPEVRQMAAFALGLIGDAAAVDALTMALDDPSFLVQGSAAEALGLVGEAAAADRVADMALRIVESGVLAQIPSDDDDARRDTPEAAYRLALYALVRLGGGAALARAALDEAGQPRVQWWPVAFALQRLADPAALTALRTLASDPHPYTRAFAVRGLGTLKDRRSVPLLLPLLVGTDRAVAIQATRALGLIADPASAPALLAIVQGAKSDPHQRLDAVHAIGAVGGEGVVDALIDILADPSPLVRAAALNSLARLDPQGFIFILSGLDPDRDWSVRASLADTLGTLEADAALPRLRAALGDEDQRVVPAVLRAITKLGPPDAADILLQHLKSDDVVVRATAATGIGDLRPDVGAAAIAEAYRFARRDPSYVARAAALAAVARYGASAAMPVLEEALGDSDWAVRRRAAELIESFDPESDAFERIRPAPTRLTPDVYEATRIVDPQVSTQVYIETDRGIIQIELAVLDAPLTVDNFVALARQGFFDGMRIHRVVADFVMQDGDPRGDGEGGPGYTIRDEVNQRPFLRGAVGIALDWADTGGSQFFITHSPQPHLDARYTVFGRVLSGMEVVDRIEQGDIIRRVRIWDGDTLTRN